MKKILSKEVPAELTQEKLVNAVLLLIQAGFACWEIRNIIRAERARSIQAAKASTDATVVIED